MDNQILMQISDWDDILLNSVNGVVSSFSSFLPNILGALLLLIVGVLISKALRRFTKSLLTKAKTLKILGKVNVDEKLDKAGIKVSLIEVISNSVYWISMLIVLMSVADILNLSVVSDTITSLIDYVPSIIAGILVIVVTIGGANLVKDIVKSSLDQVEANYSSLLSNLSYGLIVLFGSVIAINQVGIDITIITANITAIVLGISVTVAISFGFGSKDIVSNIIAGYYLKKDLKKGDSVVLDNISGKVEKITDTNIYLKTDKGVVVLANNKAMRS